MWRAETGTHFHAFICSFVCLFVYFFIHLFIHSFIQFVCLLVCSFFWFIHSIYLLFTVSCGKYSIKDKFEKCGVEKTYYATICRNCLRYHGALNRTYQSGNNCLGNHTATYCNGDCEYDNEIGICSLKTNESMFFIHFKLTHEMCALWSVKYEG